MEYDEVMRGIYTRVNARPLLVESYDRSTGVNLEDFGYGVGGPRDVKELMGVGHPPINEVGTVTEGEE